MGATTFHDKAQVEGQVQAAFTRLRDEAAWEYGHGGYTGTIAEKSGCFAFPRGLTDLAPLPERVVIAALEGQEAGVAALLGAFPALASELERAQAVYDDKWGDAVVFRVGDSWHFCGWASD